MLPVLSEPLPLDCEHAIDLEYFQQASIHSTTDIRYAQEIN